MPLTDCFHENEASDKMEKLCDIEHFDYSSLVPEGHNDVIDHIINNWETNSKLGGLSIFVDVLNEVDCTGNETTEAIINIAGGSGNYIVMIDGNPPISEVSTGIFSTTVTGGTYGITITDTDDNCMLVEIFGVGQPSPIDITAEITSIDSCSGAIMTLDLTITGGTPPYESEFNTTNTGVEVVVIDSEDCEASIFVENPIIENALVISAIQSFPSEPNEDNGSINITVEGGEPPYFFQWLDEDGNVLSTEEDIEDLAAGFYVVNLSDTNGCSISSGEIEVELSTAVSFQTSLAYSIFPNPVTSNFINVIGDEQANLDYYIVSSSGQLLKSGQLNITTQQIQLTEFEKGMYYLQLKDRQGKIELIPFVKM